MPLLASEAIRDHFRSDPSIYLHAIDLARDAALFLRLPREAFLDASFLDERILGPNLDGRWTPLETAMDLLPAPQAMLPVHFIFHTGHVGSTLVSRMLDALGGVHGLREPLPLRTLAAALVDLGSPQSLLSATRFDALLEFLLAGWARGYPETTAAIIKATSSTAACADRLLAAGRGGRALFLNLRPEAYLATLLAGENSAADLRGHAPGRMMRLQQLAPDRDLALHRMSPGELAAMSWSIETLTHRACAMVHPGQGLFLDFDAFLARPGEALAEIARHFQIAATQERIEASATGPLLSRYSKAPEHAYSPDVRQSLLAQSRSLNASEIRRGMTWIDDFMRRFPELGSLLA